MSENGKSGFIITRDEFNEALSEVVANQVDGFNATNAIRHAVNVHAEIAGLHRFLLERFIPAPILEAAVKEYSKIRNDQLAAEKAELLAHQSKKAIN